jgi:hypothetical protein
MPLMHYSKFSMFTLRIWVFKSGDLKKLFVLSKHGTKANIRSTKMANNRHAYNRDVLESCWTSDGLPLNPIEHIWDMLGRRIHAREHSSVGSSIASGMAAAITTGHPTSNWRDETQG